MVSPIFAGGGFTTPRGFANIVDLHSNEIRSRDVNESYIARVGTARQVTATLDAYPDKPFPQRSYLIPPPTAKKPPSTFASRSESGEHTIHFAGPGVKVDFLEKSSTARKARAKQKTGPQAVRFHPQDAVRSDANVSFVLLKDSHGKFERRAVVRVGPRHGSRGLVRRAPGDSFGGQRVGRFWHDGDKVEFARADGIPHFPQRQRMIRVVDGNSGSAASSGSRG